MAQAASETRSPLIAAREAYARHDWPEAHDLFAAVDQALGADDLERFGEAAWWLARLEEAISLRERAYSAYVHAGDRLGAARVALWLFLDYSSRLRYTLSTGALARAERQLADEPEGPVHGQLLVMRSFVAVEQGEHDDALAFAQQAEEIGHAHHDDDLLSLAYLTRGRTLVDRGDVEQGMEQLDRATLAAVAGELSPFATGVVYCASITACTQLADYGRASEWTEAAERWCEQQAVDSGFPGTCRVYRAEIKRFEGNWRQAEEEARRAAHELEGSFIDVAGAAYNEIGELRLRTGDLDGAESAFQSAHELGHEAQPGLSLLLLAKGREEVAAHSIREALDNPFLQPLGRAKLLPARVEVELAAGHLDEARAAAEEFAALADTYRGPSPVRLAQKLSVRAAVALAAEDLDVALDQARRALGTWRQVRSPYEVARSRLLLARVHQARGDRQSATLEAESAKRAFERLGAAPDAERAALVADGPATGGHVTSALLFTDIVTSTSLLDALGDDAWNDLVRWHDRVLRELFRAFGGEEVDHAGDGFFVVFDTASAALDCATAVQRRLEEHRREHGFAPQVRIGVHATEAIRDGDEYRGIGVHEAARIASLAGAGEVLASKAALEAAGGDVPTGDGRTVRLKGIPHPIDIASVTWQAP
jgi:class 3 adenylate cyclase